MAKLVSKIYGEALFNFAVEEKQVDNILQEARDVVNVFTTQNSLVEFISNPRLTDEEKFLFLKEVFAVKLWNNEKSKTIDFISIIIEKGRLSDIVPIFREFIGLALAYKNIGVANVVSATELTDTQKKSLLDKLVSATKYDSLEITYCVDKNLIAGLKVKINDKVFDGTYKTKISDISKSLRGLKI